MALTTIIPSIGLTAMLRFCLLNLDRALQEIEEPDNQIVVVDNSSPEPYQESDLGIENVEILRMDRKRSFAHACNRGAAQAPNDLLLFLNNDVLLAPGSLLDMVQTLEDQTAGICGARLVFPDNTIQHCGIRFNSGSPGPHHYLSRRPTGSVSRAIREFQAVTGAALLIRGDLFAQLNGFDEVYPFAFEDVDLCLRARALGARVTCSQKVDSIHFESMTPGRFEYEKMSQVIFEDRWKNRYSIDDFSEYDQ